MPTEEKVVAEEERKEGSVRDEEAAGKSTGSSKTGPMKGKPTTGKSTKESEVPDAEDAHDWWAYLGGHFEGYLDFGRVCTQIWAATVSGSSWLHYASKTIGGFLFNHGQSAMGVAEATTCWALGDGPTADQQRMSGGVRANSRRSASSRSSSDDAGFPCLARWPQSDH